MAVIVKDAVKQYGKGESRIYALDHASLEIQTGDVCVILGPSGSGKSTLLNMLGGLDHLDSGSVSVDGMEITGLSKKELVEYRRKKIGVVFQSYNLIAELTVKENIRVAQDISEHPLDLELLMEDLGIARQAAKFPSELSGGQQQRCAIGRALIKNPDLLLCDELTGALDSVSAREVLEILEKINKKYKTTIVIITHNEGIAGMADRIIRIHDGKIISNNPNKRISVKELVRHYMVYGMIPAFAGDVLGVLQSDIIPLLRGIGKEKASGILRKSSAGLSFVYNIRAVTLNGFRSITMVIGIAIATLCIILGGSFQDAYADLLEEKVPYAMLGGQYEYGFKEFQTQNPYGGDGVFDISFGAKQDDSRFNLIGYEEQNQILDLLTVDGKELSYGGYYMSSAAAKRYGISAGDSFRFYNTVTMEETEIVISGIIRNDILDLVLSSKENVTDIIERPVEEYNVIISKEPLTIPSELLRKNSSLKDYQEQAKNLSMTAGIVLKLLKVLGMLICLLIVSMMSGMIVEESTRNISMLSVLGYRSREVRRFVLTSNHLLVPVGFLIGVPLGYLTAYSMILGAAKSSGMLMSLPVKADTILSGFAFLAAAYLIAMLLAGRKCKKVDLVESLKCPL